MKPVTAWLAISQLTNGGVTFLRIPTARPARTCRGSTMPQRWRPSRPHRALARRHQRGRLRLRPKRRGQGSARRCHNPSLRNPRLPRRSQNNDHGQPVDPKHGARTERKLGHKGPKPFILWAARSAPEKAPGACSFLALRFAPVMAALCETRTFDVEFAYEEGTGPLRCEEGLVGGPLRRGRRKES
jgi:hypothetical protein